MLNRRHLCASLLAAPFVAAPSLLRAQTFPSRPIRLVVPYAAGGGTDALARVVAQAMSERSGWSVVVENLTGAGGNLATMNVASAPADGYTMLQANQGPMAVNPHIFKNLKVNPLTAFDPITLIAAAPLVVVVPPKSEFTDVKQLMAYAKANPGKLTYGSAGNGSASHLAAVLLNVVAKVDTVHVPYKGAGPALNDLLGAQTQFMVTTIPSVLGMIEGKLLRPLAVTSKERVAVLPGVPTIAESGWPDYESTAWYGFVVPAGTPKDVIETLRKATVEAINTPLVKQRLEGEGARPVGNTPAEFAAFIKKDSARWAEIARTGVINLN
ncbi:tripartite tricarboxylate transporter substrate binding protein [Rhodoplanes sp. TEM]|uniref:Tripartite tricarboxylate transporter substrate binding protein n=1 Tax=Rhodoplanes tepidamans TaxID=200616 RepID=A0ABT5JJ80_RHOTP|nr:MULTISPECIES: tripartite tricarboxylate transporter substrate binding protein [Rhodoplanes]MDC7789629.1 tripartite tricarboxylate transporter substrate binding protein [Rhodoplanes tepidamans]MDC7987383.1 tripartite tricarboxylate transporter substrate binding protein [Rhodoplanes sp. TEM]MDQ0359180.1 tripartite-type tricarboxylate transporter receptor subunit TctC [Rhodoplanes tepidamans]